nr:NADH dehydrogenase subunit 2 [Xylophagaidae sp. E23]UPX88978.1 NADH dehydrogenase subunit 2 [Xylophagaidae sp. E81]
MVFSAKCFNSSFVLMSMLTSLGVVLVLLSGGLLGVWVGLECGFLGVLVILAGKSSEENEACMKYFVFQSIGSAILFISFVMLETGSSLLNPWMLLFWGMALKLGLFPFYFWVPSVMGLCSYLSCFIISVWQKISPLWFISGCGLGGYLSVGVCLIVCLTGILGGVGGLGCLHFRTLLGYSSLIQTSWMVLVSLVSSVGVMFYLFVYSLVLGGLMSNLYSLKVYTYLDFAKGGSFKSSAGLFSVLIDFISLAGIPPFLGSVPKILGILMCWEFFPVPVSVLVFCSMLSLYYYLSVSMAAGLGLGVTISFLKFENPGVPFYSVLGYFTFFSIFLLMMLGLGN